MSQYGTNKEELVTFFGKTRDDLIVEDLGAWVGLNKVLKLYSILIATAAKILSPGSGSSHFFF